MDSETWALVGVIVGAILGGAAQVVADWLRREHERQSTLRMERRESYTEFLAASTGVLAPIASSRSVFKNDRDEKSRSQQEAEGVVLSSARESLDRVSVAAARIQLVGPDDTHAAAMTVLAAVMHYMFKDEEGMAERLADAHTSFARLAKRDLA